QIWRSPGILTSVSPTRGLEILLDSPDGRPVLWLSGFVDPSTAPELRETLMGLIDEGHRRIDIDLGNVTFMDSSGIGALAHAYRPGAELTVRNPVPIVMRELVMCGLDRLVTIAS